MPDATLQSLSKKVGVDMKRAEELWKKAKDAATAKGLDPDSDDYWAYVVGTVKKMLGVESIDLLKVGYNPKVLSEAVISKGSASFMKSRMRKVTDELSHVDDETTPTNWKSLALNLRLFFNEYLSALSSRTGLKALLLGEGSNDTVPSILRRIQEVGSVEELINIYVNALPDVNRSEVEEAIYA